MKNKKWIVLFLAMIGMSFTLGAATGKKITAEIRNQEIINNGSKTNKQVISYNGITYVPLREFSSMLGEDIVYRDGIIYLGAVSNSKYDYNNPAPIGTEQITTSNYYSVGDYSAQISVGEVIRGDKALDMLKATKGYICELAGNQEFLIAKIKVKVINMEKPGTIPIDGNNFVAYSANNTQYMIDIVITKSPEPALRANLNVGSSTEGYIVIPIDKNDSAPKIAFRKNDGTTIANGAWFSLAK